MRHLESVSVKGKVKIKKKKQIGMDKQYFSIFKPRIIVYDEIMGSGKTSRAIKRMEKYVKKNQKFIYVTPFLSEIERIQFSLSNKNIFTPTPMNEYKNIEILVDENGDLDCNKISRNIYTFLNKRDHLLKLVSEGKNIATTHSLYTSLRVCDAELFKNYVLIIDESINPIRQFKVGQRDLKILINEKLVTIDPDSKRVKSTDNKYKDASFKSILDFCKKDNVFLQNSTFINLFPIEIMLAFRQVQILTYLFKGSLMAYYFELYNTKYTVIKNTRELGIKKPIKDKLQIYEGHKNQNHKLKSNAYCMSYFERLDKLGYKNIINATISVFRYEFNTRTAENAFTTFKDYRQKLKGRGYTKGHIPVNSRATNEFSHKKSMAYLANRYLNPAILNFFHNNGVNIDQDLWALTELIQWVWRGAIRNNENMNLYIPSDRMRNLLIRWLNDEI